MFALKSVNIFVRPILTQNEVNNDMATMMMSAWSDGGNLFYSVHLLIHQPKSVHDNGKITTYNNF